MSSVKWIIIVEKEVSRSILLPASNQTGHIPLPRRIIAVGENFPRRHPRYRTRNPSNTTL
jgi:hypothetical protein